jgi:hypothetical protein
MPTIARIPASTTSATLRRAEERGYSALGGSVGLVGAVSRPLAIDLEKFRFKGLPIRLGQKYSKFGDFP